MGQWATRSRRGGGPPQPSALISITSAAVVGIGDPTSATVNYSAPVSAAAFVPGTFTSLPSAEVGTSIAQVDPDTIEIAFTGDVDTDSSLSYAGVVAGILTPQAIGYT